MIKKALFCTDLTRYCDYVFDYVLNAAIKYKARLWIYHGLGRVHLSDKKTAEEIKKAGARVVKAYTAKMKKRGFDKFVINVTDGDTVTEITKLARDAKVDVIFMGPSTKEPVAVGEAVRVAPLGRVVTETILWAPCPVMVVPPAMLPGLTRG
jgi:nucleotide-binding universal stress UspA family protein